MPIYSVVTGLDKLFSNVVVHLATIHLNFSDYVIKYFDVKKHAFLRDFGRFHAKFLFVNHPRNNRCQICAFVLKRMRVFSNLMCENAHCAALTLSMELSCPA